MFVPQRIPTIRAQKTDAASVQRYVIAIRTALQKLGIRDSFCSIQ